MAEGFARAMAGDRVEVYSAGTHATGVVSEDAIMMMEELGIDIRSQTSNRLDAVPLDEIDIVVSMAPVPARDLMPAEFRGRAIDWDVEDPIGWGLGTFRRVRDELQELVKDLIEELD